MEGGGREGREHDLTKKHSDHLTFDGFVPLGFIVIANSPWRNFLLHLKLASRF